MTWRRPEILLTKTVTTDLTYTGKVLAAWEWISASVTAIMRGVITYILRRESNHPTTYLSIQRNLTRIFILTVIAMLISVAAVIDGSAVIVAQRSHNLTGWLSIYKAHANDFYFSGFNMGMALLTFGVLVVLRRTLAIQLQMRPVMCMQYQNSAEENL